MPHCNWCLPPAENVALARSVDVNVQRAYYLYLFVTGITFISYLLSSIFFIFYISFFIARYCKLVNRTFSSSVRTFLQFCLIIIFSHISLLDEYTPPGLNVFFLFCGCLSSGKIGEDLEWQAHN